MNDYGFQWEASKTGNCSWTGCFFLRMISLSLSEVPDFITGTGMLKEESWWRFGATPEIRLIYKTSYSRSVAIVVVSCFQDNNFIAVTQKLVTLAGEFIAMCTSPPLWQKDTATAVRRKLPLNTNVHWLSASWTPLWLIMIIGTLII